MGSRSEAKVIALLMEAIRYARAEGFDFHIDGSDLDLKDEYGDYVTTLAAVSVD